MIGLWRAFLNAFTGRPPSDPKSRGPAYRRGFADGVLAGRAGITATRLPGSNDDEENHE